VFFLRVKTAKKYSPLSHELLMSQSFSVVVCELRGIIFNGPGYHKRYRKVAVYAPGRPFLDDSRENPYVLHREDKTSSDIEISGLTPAPAEARSSRAVWLSLGNFAQNIKTYEQ
jgi:hypothetical protein